MNIEENKSFDIFECVKIVSGKFRSVIIDFNRKEYYYVPNNLASALLKRRGKMLKFLLYDLIEYDYNEVIKDLFDAEILYYIDDYNIGEFTTISNEYAELPLQHLEIDLETFIKDPSIYFCISNYGCETLSVFVENSVSIESIETLNNAIYASPFTRIVIYIDYLLNEERILDAIINLSNSNPKFRHTIVFNSKQKMSSKSYSYDNRSLIDLMVSGPSQKFIVPTLHLFIETGKYNSYFNGRLYIDSANMMRPSKFSPTSIISFSYENLDYYLESKEYLFYALARKGLIQECKNCEHRRMCTDRRIPFISDSKLELVYKEKCDYDKVSGIWGD